MDRPSVFGPSITDHIQGNLATPSLLFGCEPVEAPVNDWVALVQRGGGCSFAEKVRAMQQSHAIAVVIGDPHYNGWITMYATGDTSDIEIPSMYVAQYQYGALMEQVRDRSVSVVIIKDEEPTWTLTDMMIIIVLSPSIMMLMMYFSWKYREYQQQLKDLAPCHVVSNLPSRVFHREKAALPPMTVVSSSLPAEAPASAVLLANHPSSSHATVVVADRLPPPEECAICLEDYAEGDCIRILPCLHEFHASCIDTWLTTRKKFCPICKFNICQGRHQQTNEDPAEEPEEQQVSLAPGITEQTPLLPC
ncbi:hypothetical protein DM01DRAFT_1378848 [Hesseltinella vesiculosa]|uniref:RING-type E3 ubiquitin transferase n=1 Tax=Hesseltinella vesiculosa TaxID=101127 RepID=A0A1X2G2Y1_9FUNG|nr:hypothetical protein DM01DRAFT_1378848 [Hesseltinella vesiculosa]